MTEIISVYYKYAWVWNNVFFALDYAINIVNFLFLTTVFTQNEDWLFLKLSYLERQSSF